MRVRLTKRDGARALEITLLTPRDLPPIIELDDAVYVLDQARGDCLQYVERPDLPESAD